MDKLAYTTNLRLRLAGMLMDMWIFFLFVAIAGECETILFLVSCYARLTLRLDSIRRDFQILRIVLEILDPLACACACVPDRVSIRRVARSVTWSACCHSTCQ